MKIWEVDVPIFNYHIDFLFVTSKHDAYKIEKFLASRDILKEDYQFSIDIIKNDKHGGGVTFFCENMHSFIVVVYKEQNKDELISTITHEIRHIVDDMCHQLNIEDVETPAYITGYISMNIFKEINDIDNKYCKKACGFAKHLLKH